MQIYNTLTKSLEEFQSIEPNKVRFYQCGPTVYWVQHIGNLRAMTMSDLMRRSFIYLGYEVAFVRNYTDVGHLTSDADTGEDKMEKGSKREGLTPNQIADKYITIFEKDIALLNTIPPLYTPRATQYVKEIIEMVHTIVEKGKAYVTKYAVYFDVSTFPQYNKLNHQKLDQIQKGLGKGTVEDPDKKHFSDFALWVFKKGTHTNALQTWNSPWGEGFPGWHIECSAMAKKLLGTTLDIHMGGIEHISIHHTNEIAQSETANEAPFVHYWIHNEHLNVNDAKMAKSEGTSFTLQQIIDKGFSPLDLRYFFLNAHYRSKQNFTWEALTAAQSGRSRMGKLIEELRRDSQQHAPTSNGSKILLEQFKNFIENDFQIPAALALAWDVVKSTDPLIQKEKGALLESFDRIFGLDLFKQVYELIIPQSIIDLAEQRKIAKIAKQYIKADDLRKQIEAKGYKVEDTKGEYKIIKI